MFSIYLTRLDKLLQVVRYPALLRGLLRHRVLAGAEHRCVLAPELKTVVDIGANRGQFALAARQWSRAISDRYGSAILVFLFVSLRKLKGSLRWRVLSYVLLGLVQAQPIVNPIIWLLISISMNDKNVAVWTAYKA